MNIEVFLQIFLWFKFCTSVQICIYLPTFVLIYTLCNRCCPTERYIRTVRISGDLCLGEIQFDPQASPSEELSAYFLLADESLENKASAFSELL